MILIYIYIYIHTHIHTYTSFSPRLSAMRCRLSHPLHWCAYVCMYVCMYACKCMHACMSMHVCMHVCVYMNPKLKRQLACSLRNQKKVPWLFSRLRKETQLFCLVIYHVHAMHEINSTCISYYKYVIHVCMHNYYVYVCIP